MKLFLINVILAVATLFVAFIVFPLWAYFVARLTSLAWFRSKLEVQGR